MTQYREPTADECSTHATVQLTDNLTGVACWYPTMGGYVGMAVAVDTGNGDFDVYVWHDGQFPFSGEDDWRGRASPVELHHCDADQFIAFGNLLNRIAAGVDVAKRLPPRLNLADLLDESFAELHLRVREEGRE